jgi:prolyl-tRNA synthetase
MRLSSYPIANLKDSPAEAEVISHRLMLRAGLIRRLAGGLYTWLPMGLRVLRKVENIIREEMNRAGALELLMPTIQPAELWQESGRWEQFGPELLRLQDRHERDFVYGPTHEEVITDIARRELKSYRQLPVNFYQIQLKFRDEIRPRFGVMRAREFIMKDAYSFHRDEASLDQGYQAMYQAYTRAFTRMGLKFRAVLADPGAIGGTGSQEFHVLAQSGEDAIAFSDGDDYAANLEKAEALPPTEPRAKPSAQLQTVSTPGVHTIAALAEFLSVPTQQTVKTLIVEGKTGELVALVLRGDHELNVVKAQNHPRIANPLKMADPAVIEQQLGCPIGSIGPVGLSCLTLVDHSAAQLSDFVAGANQKDQHLTGVNWGRDLPEPTGVDLRNVIEGDPSPTGQGRLHIARGIEVGHVFKLGQKYSHSMQAQVLDEQGQSIVPYMGCYGIGVTRVVAAAIEQNHDEQGIIWPEPLAPFQVVLVALNATRSDSVRQTSEELYQQLTAAGIEVLFDDRDERPGIKFADAELYGIPHRLVVGDKGASRGVIEYRSRSASDNEEWPLSSVLNTLRERLVTHG